MAFLALTRKGYETYKQLGQTAGSLWIAAGVLSETELELARQGDSDISDFNYIIEPDALEVILDAIETIKEHHPGECIWVEY